MFSTNRANARFLIKTVLFGLGIGGLLASGNFSIRAGGQKPTTPPKSAATQNPEAKIQPKADLQGFGDVKIRRFTKGQTGPNFSSFHLTGPETEIEVPDKASNAVLLVHADDILLEKDGPDFVGNITLTGHLRYTLTQKSKEGLRRVEGTAGHGTFQRKTHRIELTQGVQATFTDEKHLSGPARLRSENLTIDITDSPYLYTAVGAPSINDVKFTLRGKPDKENKPTESGTAHVYGYQTGSFRVGETAKFTGGYTTVDFDNPVDDSKTHLQARIVTVDFAADGSDVRHIDAQKELRFHYTQPKPMSKVVQEVSGTAPHAIFDNAMGRTITVYKTEIEVVDPERLSGPAHIRAESVTIDATAAPYLYKIEGAPSANDVKFTLLGKPDGEKKPMERGTAHIYGFQSGSFRMGETARFTGGYTSVDFDNPLDKSKTHFQARIVTVDFAADGSELRHIDAQKEVRFHHTQPKPMSKVMQAVSGTADHATFDRTMARQVALFARLDVDIVDPEQLEGPGHIHGFGTDSLILNLDQGNTFIGDSPNQTMTFDFVPKQLPDAPGPAQPAPGAPKKGADAPPK